MEGIFQEFENENSLRTYPFAAGCVPADGDREIPDGLFVDAALYPINPNGILYLSSVSEKGTFVVSDGAGEIMDGTVSGNVVELVDRSAFRRHVGTLVASSAEVLEDFAGRGVSREYLESESAFASSCVFPVVIDGVTSMSLGESAAHAGNVSFSNGDEDEIRVSSGTKGGNDTLRFDILPKPGLPDTDSIRRIICVVDGETPFRIEKLAYNVVMVRLDGIDKDTICSAAHRENGFEMVDTCECGKQKPPRPTSIPEAYQLLETFIPPDDVPEGAEFGPEGGIADGADNAFYLVVPNTLGYVNPLSITMEDGIVSPRTSDPNTVVDGMTADLADGALVDSVTSKCVVIQVPGLSGGEI